MTYCTKNTIEITIRSSSPQEELEACKHALFAILKAACSLDPDEFSAIRVEIHDTIVLLEAISRDQNQNAA